jgi:hypothetical protein
MAALAASMPALNSSIFTPFSTAASFRPSWTICAAINRSAAELPLSG